jgi:hypothetical protein
MTTNTDTRIVKVHVAEVEPRTSYGPDTWGSPEFSDEAVKIRLFSRHQGSFCTWSVLYVGPEGECCRTFGGPIEPGPYAALIPHSTCIADCRIPGDRAPVVALEEGDLIVIRGVAFRIDDSRGRFAQNPQLVPVTV